LSFSQITIASLMAGAPVQPAMAQNPAQFTVNARPVVAGQLESPLPLYGRALVTAETRQPAEDKDPQLVEPVNASGTGPASPDDSPEARSLDPASDGLAPAPDEPVDGEPTEDDNTIVVTARPETPTDPLMELNADTFDVVQDVDRAFVEPVAMTYKKAVPSPLRSGLRNFLRNLGEPVVFLNYLLQLKPGKAFETLGRFTINTTIGIGGVLDVAKDPPFYLPHRSNGFANTFGYYGIEPGAFLYLPLVGPTTVRDLVGDTLNLLVLPTVVGKPFTERTVTIPIAILNTLDSRIELDDQINEIREGDADPYTTAREFYLTKRQTEIDILRGRIPDPLSRKSRESGSSSLEAEPNAPAATNPLAPETNIGVSDPVGAPEAETDPEPSAPDPSSSSEEPPAPELSGAPAEPHSPPQSGAAAELH
jgi:phospholipid-binding lipoprotein MlaA